MLSKVARWQLIAFVVIGLVGVVIVGAQYVRLDRFLGFGTYSVYADFENSGGIFSNAQVTYRGTPVGRVGDVTLNGDVVRVELQLDKSAPKIPEESWALVVNRSAVGEQYVDLQPAANSDQYLEAGDVISAEKTSAPVPVEQFLQSADSFLGNVPLEDLTSVVNELGDAFEGRGEDLSTLLASLDKLSAEGVEALPDIRGLIEDGAVVFGTQAMQSGVISKFAADLDIITAQLRDNDGDIRRLISTSDSAGATLSSLTGRVGGDLTQVLHQSDPLIMGTIGPRDLAINALVTLLPRLAGGSLTTGSADGTIHFGLVLETNSPPPCTQGYEDTWRLVEEERQKNPNFNPQTDPFPLNLGANCTLPLGDRTGVRSASKAPFFDPNNPVPWDNTPKKDPDKLNLTPLMTQVAELLGVTYNR